MSVDKVIGGNIVTRYGVFNDTYIAIKDGRITAIGDKSAMPPAAEALDYSNLLILPGCVDTHTHSLGTPEEGHWNSTRAAAAGGVTTINDHPLDIGGAPASIADIEKKAEKMAKEVFVDYCLLAGGLPEQMEDITATADMGVTGYKILMHATSGASAYKMRAVDDGELYALFELIAQGNQVAMVHAENEALVSYLVKKWTDAGKTYMKAHCETRPEVTETEAVSTAIEFARDLNCRLHLLHLSVPRSFDLVEQARAEGYHITGETCAHFLLCNDDRWKDVGAQYKINPPLRSEASRLGLWKKIQDGKVQVISSDHAPHPENNKPNIFDNFSGTPGIEHMLPMIYSEGVHTGRIGLERMTEMMSYNPARLMGIYPQKGSIEVGADADLVVFDPKKEWVVEGKKAITQAKWSLYEGMKVTGNVEATFVRGSKVYESGQVVGTAGYGRWVKKSRIYDL